MINIKRSLLSLFSFIAILVLGLYISTGSSALLRAEDAPGVTRHYVSERMGIPSVSINGSLATSYMTNGYYDMPVNQFNNLSIGIPNLDSAIDNFEIATIERSIIRIEVSQAGSVVTPLNWSEQTFKSQYYGTYFNGYQSGMNNTSGGRPIYYVDVEYDAKNIPSYNYQSVALWLTTNNGITPITTTGQIRVHSVTVLVDYHYDVDDPISPIVDGAGALVESVNLYKMNPFSDINFLDTGLFVSIDEELTITINGTSSKIMELYFDSKDYDFTGNYTYSFYYVSGTVSSFNGITLRGRDTQNININTQILDYKDYYLNISNPKNFTVRVDQTHTFQDFKFKLQIEEGDTSSTWMHPDAKYYSMASIQHDQNLDSTDTIMSNVYAFDDVDGNISDRLTVVRTPRDYAAAIANAWGIRVNDALSAYDDETLSIPITSTITFDNAYVDSQFLIYQETTFWYMYDNDLIEALGTSQSYPFIAYVGDNAGNYTFLEIQVFVNDATAPVFDAANPINTTVSYKTTLDLNVWKEALIITDNVDDYVERTIYQDNYTANKAVPGTYVITVRATDEVGNIKDKNYNIIVVDDIKPVFNGPESIYKPQSSSMTIQDILKRYTAFDEISGNVTSRIYVHQDNYTGRGHIENTYTVILRVSDLANNVEYFTIYITVTDDIPPVIYVADGYFIQVSAAYTLTIEGIRDILVATGRLNIVSATTWSVLVNEYQGNENTPGIYTVSIRFQQTSGVTEVHSVAIGVKNASSTPGGTMLPESSNGYIYIIAAVAVIGLIIILKKRK